jgi:putative GTP pyrophosphokinase
MRIKQFNKKRKGYGAFRKKYDKNRPTYEAILKDILEKLGEIKKKADKSAMLRISHIKGRIKTPHSIIRKAVDRKIPASKIYNSIDDIIGVRVVVNNTIDIKAVIEELKKIPNLAILQTKKHKDPKGYRGTHLSAVYKHSGGASSKYSCEIQIRTVFEDAWAILSHHDVYKNANDLPPLGRSISENMSSLLSSLNKMAGDLRKAISAKVKSPNDLSDEAPLDKEGLVFLYYELFGAPPDEYEIHYIYKVVKELRVKKIGDTRKGLKIDIFAKLTKIHNKRFWVDMSNSDLLEFGIRYAAVGKAVFKQYRERIEEEWAEVEAIARREALSGMPETYGEFLEALKNDSVPWEALKELGAIQSCYRCGNDILFPSTAAEEVAGYYDHDDHGELESLFSGLPEAEDYDFSGACSYCGWQMSKDD